MSLEIARRYAFEYGVIVANAPRASGVYALFHGAELLYVGEAENIYSRLLDHFDRNQSIGLDTPTAFAFELCATEARKVKLMGLVFKLRPLHTERPELKIRED